MLIDEIQHAPELLPVLKLAIDEDREPGSFWLTGSAQFSAMRGISETLAGRVAIINLLGFSLAERSTTMAPEPFLPGRAHACVEPPLTLDTAFEHIWRGSMPELCVRPELDRELYLRSYLQTYLQRDVRSLTNVGDLISFTKFLRACAARTGQLLNLSDLARDVDVSVPTAKAWLSVLEASFVVYLLRPYSNNQTKRLVKTPKLYFLDTGLCSYLTGWTSPETAALGAMSGALFETHVVSEILKSWWHRGKEPPIFFYRDRDGREVDVVFELDRKLYAVEAKRAATVKRSWGAAFRPLERLGLPLAAASVVSLVDESLPIDERTTALPVGCIA